MINYTISNSVISKELTERYETTVLHDEWIIIHVCMGQGSFQVQSYIQDFNLYDCFLIQPEHKIVIVPKPNSICRVYTITFSSEVILIHISNRSALKILNAYLNATTLITSFTLSKEIISLFNHYASLLYEIQSNSLPYTILIYQHTLSALLLMLARNYALMQPEKIQASKEISSRLFMIENVKHFINQNYSEDLPLSNIANYVFANPSYLSRIFKKTTGIALSSYINEIRIAKAKQLLIDTDNLIIDIAVACGFNYIPHFNLIFKASTNMTPTQFRKSHKIKRY